MGQRHRNLSGLCAIYQKKYHTLFLSFILLCILPFFSDVFFYLLNKSSNSLVLFFNIETIIIFRNILSYRMWFSAKVKRLKDYELFLTAWQTSETTEMVHLFSVKHRAVYGLFRYLKAT